MFTIRTENLRNYSYIDKDWKEKELKLDRKNRKKMFPSNVVLPVCAEPPVRTYSYYAFPLCIMMAEDKIGKRIAEFEILDSSESGEWNSQNLKKEGTRWFYETVDVYNRGCNGCLYQALQEKEGYIHVKIHFQQESEPWAAVNLFLTDDKENVLLGDNDYLCRFGNFIYGGVSLYFNGKKEELPIRLEGSEGEFVLQVARGKVECYFGQRKLCKVGEQKIDDGKQLYIGVQVRHEENSFYPWLFSNFISISSNLGDLHRRLDYYNFFKDEQFDLTSYFLDYNHIRVKDLIWQGGIEAVKWELSQGRYMEMKLDQYYLEGREEYHFQHHVHQNLIYGFDEKKKCLFLIGYDNNGKIGKFNISYRDWEESIQRYPDIVVKNICYHQGFRFFRFLEKHVKKMCRDYLAGANPELATHSFLPTEKRKFGIDIYEDLCTGEGLDVLVADRRVSYLLYEHKVLMEKRVEYMWRENLLSQEVYEVLKEAAHKMTAVTFNLIHVTQKYRFRPDKREDALLCELLQSIKKEEEILMNQFIGEWKSEKKSEESTDEG